MRFLNWDVLLFPETSRVPVQEFRTACHAVHDTEILHEDYVSGLGPIPSPLSLTSRLLCVVFPDDELGNNPHRQIPIMTSFVANQMDGMPFKISIHTWWAPGPSQGLQPLLDGARQPCFEARTFIDGALVA